MRAWRTLSVLLALSLGAGAASGQSMVEAAAKERERREQQKKTSQEGQTFSNDDLSSEKKAKEAAAKAAAAGKNPPTVRKASRPPVGQRRSSDTESERRRQREHEGVEEEGVEAISESETPGTVGAEQADTDPTKTESYWRGRASDARAILKPAEQAVADAQKQLTKLRGELLLSTDTNQIMQLREQISELEGQLENAKSELANVQRGLQELEDEARQAGVPPGWIR